MLMYSSIPFKALVSLALKNGVGKLTNSVNYNNCNNHGTSCVNKHKILLKFGGGR